MRLLTASLAILLSCGCCQTAGSGVGKGVTKFTHGVGEGVDENLLVEVRFSDEATRLGLGHTTAKRSGKKVTIYVTSKAPFEGRLLARAVNKEGNEIGRSILPGSFTADDAKYLVFPFPNEMDSHLVTVYWVETLK